MMIDPIAALSAAPSVSSSERTGLANTDFAAVIGQQVSQLNQTLQAADAATVDFALNGATPVHELMLTIEHAKMSLQFAVEVRNRAVEAYQELMRMQL